MRQDEHGNLIADDGTFYRHSGAGHSIGLNSDDEIAFGYDSMVIYWDDPADDYGGTNGLFDKHRREFADYMIAKWTAWRDKK